MSFSKQGRSARLCAIVIITALLFVALADEFNGSAAAESGDFEGGIAIVVHNSNHETIRPDEAKAIFLGERSTWGASGGGIKVVIQQKNATASRAFNRILFNDSGNRMSWQWVENVITGSVPAPLTLRSDEDVLDLIARDSSAIGYVSSGSLAGRTVTGVRVVLSLGPMSGAQ